MAGLLTADGIIDGRHAGRVTGIVAEGRTFSFRLNETVTITQNDVRAIQLAKAALYAGARLLMDALAVTRVERIVLAGAFGSQIDPLYAMVLGMLPDCDPAAVRAAGNAAGTGAVMALLDRHARPAIETTVRRVEKSKPPSPRLSRSISSPPWRFPMASTTSPAWPKPSTCRRRHPLQPENGNGVKLSSTALAVRLSDRCILSGPRYAPEHHQIGFRLH